MIKKLITSGYGGKSLCGFCTNKKCKSEKENSFTRTIVCGRFNFKVTDENIKELFFSNDIVNFGRSNPIFNNKDYVTLSDAIKVVTNILKNEN
jgi:hypothetical protein